jgi:predicted nucleic acid-binding protein
VASDGVLVDTNVLLDVLSEDSSWYGWSSRTLYQLSGEVPLAINPVIFAEVSMRFDTLGETDVYLPAEYLLREPIPYEAAFLAGKAFLRYRGAGGPRQSLLPDFLIGAHAAVMGYRILTRDPRRYRAYFPTLELIAP